MAELGSAILRRRVALLTALAICAAGPAQAVSIQLTGVSLTLNAANTANQTASSAGNLTSINQPDGGGSNPYGATGVIDAGGLDSDAQIGNTLDAATRYASAVWADGSVTRNMTSSYRITFSVNADPGVLYDLMLSHDLEGVLQTDSPGLLNGCGGCAASVSNVTATVISNGGGVVGGSLVQNTALSIGGDTESNVTAAPALLTITGLSGNQTFVIDFSWTASAATGASDDAAARFGLQPNGGAFYGNPSLSGPGDGHFVNIQTTVTMIPEPETFALFALGLAGLAWGSRAREPRGGVR